MDSMNKRSGQVMVEYMIVVGVLVAMVSVTALLLYVLKENGVRILNLVASDYP